MVASTLAELVADPYAAKSYLVILSPFNGTEVETVFLSDRGFVSRPDESPPNIYFDPRVMEALNFQRSMFQSGRVGGESIPSFGTIILSNADGGLDDFATFAWDNRDVEVRIGEKGARLNEHFTIFKGKTKAVEFNDLEISVIIRDGQDSFTRTFPPNVYGGTGGTDGSSIMAGTPKPLCFGQVFNITPVLVDEANNVYQVHDGPIESIDAVFKNGNSTTNFTADLSNGRFTLDTAPSGVITCDVKGAKPGGSYKQTVADIIRFIASEFAGFSDPADFDTASFDDLNTDNGSTVGVYVDRFTNILDVFDQLINSVGGFYGFTRTGEFNVGRLTAPSGTALLELDTTNIIELQRLPTSIPNHRVNFRYKKNYTVLDEDTIGGSADDRDFVLRESAVETVNSPSILTEYPNSETLEIDSRLIDATAASNEASRTLGLYGDQRDVYRIRVKTQPFTIRLNDLIRVTFPRYDLTGGKLFRVISLFEDAAINEVELELWG